MRLEHRNSNTTTKIIIKKEKELEKTYLFVFLVFVTLSMMTIIVCKVRKEIYIDMNTGLHDFFVGEWIDALLQALK